MLGLALNKHVGLHRFKRRLNQIQAPFYIRTNFFIGCVRFRMTRAMGTAGFSRAGHWPVAALSLWSRLAVTVGLRVGWLGA